MKRSPAIVDASVALTAAMQAWIDVRLNRVNSHVHSKELSGSDLTKRCVCMYVKRLKTKENNKCEITILL